MIYQFKQSLPNINFLIIKGRESSSFIVDQVQEWDGSYQIYKDQKFTDITKYSEFINSNIDKKIILSKIFELKMSIL